MTRFLSLRLSSSDSFFSTTSRLSALDYLLSFEATERVPFKKARLPKNS